MRTSKYALFMGLSFSSGLPLALVTTTLQAWLVDEQIDLATIGLFSLIGLPYNLKFVWSALFDQFFSKAGWILILQIALGVTLLTVALLGPHTSMALFATCIFLIASFSASQDTANDAFRTDALKPEEYHKASGFSNLGYRLAVLYSGAFALMFSEIMPWKWVYILMGFTMLALTGLYGWSHKIPSPYHPPQSFRAALIEPFREFFKRPRSFEIFSFIILYRLDSILPMALMTPFMMGLGFSKMEIASVNYTFGLGAILLGTFLGGIISAYIGTISALALFGFLQAISGACFYLLAHFGYEHVWLVAAIAGENFFSGMGNVAFSALLMSLCHPRYTATQYALFTSVMSLTRTLAGAPAGWLVEQLGWENFFFYSIFLSLPSFLLLLRFPAWSKRGVEA